MKQLLKILNRTLSVLLAVTMLVTMMPQISLNAFAEEMSAETTGGQKESDGQTVINDVDGTDIGDNKVTGDDATGADDIVGGDDVTGADDTVGGDDVTGADDTVGEDDATGGDVTAGEDDAAEGDDTAGDDIAGSDDTVGAALKGKSSFLCSYGYTAYNFQIYTSIAFFILIIHNIQAYLHHAFSFVNIF